MYQLLRSLLYIYIYISLFNIRQLSIKTANEIHYCGTYTDPHYQPLPVQSSRYLLLSRNMPIIENEYFVAKNVRVLDESYLYFPCCKNHHTRLILLSSVLYSLYPFIDSHLSIVLFIHPANPPTHPPTHTSIVGVEKLYIFCILNFWWYHLIQLKIFFLLNVVIPLHVLAFDFSGSWDTRSSFTFMGIGDYVLYKNTERNFEVTCFVLLVAV